MSNCINTSFIKFLFVMTAYISASAIAQEIPFNKNVSLEVGQSAIIHGARGKCGQSAPDWDRVLKYLPIISLGKFSDGGLGTRKSRMCGGETPARAILFTATTPGTEQIELFDDTIVIEVK